ncbi:MAG: hypothetical protein ACMXYC_00230 [Candidatus Woesearchaeota archaeon]
MRTLSIAAILSMFLYCIAIITIAAVSDTPIGLVFIGTVIVPLYIALIFSLLAQGQMNIWYYWALPIGLCAIFFLLWQSTVFQALSLMDGPVIIVLSLLMMYTMNIVLVYVYHHPKQFKKEIFKEQHVSKQHVTHEPKVEHIQQERDYYKHAAHTYHQHYQQMHGHKMALEKQVTHLQQQLRSKQQEITQETLPLNLRSIEDKCKAINFVVGRVYSYKQGGTVKIREQLVIPRDWYNEFSELASDFDEHKAQQLLNVLRKIYMRLMRFELPEHKVIDSQRKQTILTILKENDKDPIEDYFTETKAICTRLITYLENNYKVK